MFILAGQSNMAGLARRDQMPEELRHAGPLVDHVLVNAPPLPPGSWERLGMGYGLQDQILLDQFFPGTSVSEVFGPEWGFGLTVAQDFAAGVRVALIKYALEGTNLAEDWRAGEGPLYRELVSRIVAALNGLSDGFDVRLRAFIWMQGESDAHRDEPGNAHGGLARGYEENLERFVRGIRYELAARGCSSDEHLPFVLGRISDSSVMEFASEVRAAQLAVTQNLPRVGMVSTDSLSLEDGVHYDTRSVLELGRLFAKAAVNAVEVPAVFRVGQHRFLADGDRYCLDNGPGADGRAPAAAVLPWSLHYVGQCSREAH